MEILEFKGDPAKAGYVKIEASNSDNEVFDYFTDDYRDARKSMAASVVTPWMIATR